MPRLRTSEEGSPRGGRAGKVAARRKDAWKAGRSRPNHSGRPKERRGPKRRGEQGAPRFRALKLAGLLLSMVLLGFAVVFVVDSAASLIGKAKVGEATVAELIDKVLDRFLDRDVPRREEKPAPVVAKPARAPAPKPAPVVRGELPAPAPEAYAAASEPLHAGDPKVEEAKARLDEIFDRALR